MIDVAYFLAWSIEEQDRRCVEQDLLKTYWSTLRHHGIEGYSLNQCLHDYRLSLLYTLQIAVFALALLDFRTARDDALVTTFLRRLAASLQDHDVAALLPP